MEDEDSSDDDVPAKLKDFEKLRATVVEMRKK